MLRARSKKTLKISSRKRWVCRSEQVYQEQLNACVYRGTVGYHPTCIHSDVFSSRCGKHRVPANAMWKVVMGTIEYKAVDPNCGCLLSNFVRV